MSDTFQLVILTALCMFAYFSIAGILFFFCLLFKVEEKFGIESFDIEVLCVGWPATFIILPIHYLSVVLPKQLINLINRKE